MKIYLKLWNMFTNALKQATAQTILKTNIEDYQRELIASEAAASYNTKMAEYYREGIVRLQSQVNDE